MHKDAPSKVNISAKVPTADARETERGTAAQPAVLAAAARHASPVADVHAVVRQAEVPTRPDAVRSDAAKLRPKAEAREPPVATPLCWPSEDNTGAERGGRHGR